MEIERTPFLPGRLICHIPPTFLWESLCLNLEIFVLRDGYNFREFITKETLKQRDAD